MRSDSVDATRGIVMNLPDAVKTVVEGAARLQSFLRLGVGRSFAILVAKRLGLRLPHCPWTRRENAVAEQFCRTPVDKLGRILLGS